MPPGKVTFSSAEFQAAVAPTITSEYIYNTYGITVEDSFGDATWAPKAWSEQELVLLNDVLKELPPELIKTMAVTRIVRNTVFIDQDGNPKPATYGVYDPCGAQTIKNCDGSRATIRIFDHALTPSDFANDPNGYKEFKATILHELTHALQSHKEENAVYADPEARIQHNYASSPLVQNYMDATRPITNMTDPGFWKDNGWGTRKDGTWGLVVAPGNQTPTDYARTSPAEDLSESVMMYVYDPGRLQGASPQRYNFIRDQIFGGVEYEDGSKK